MSLPGPQGGLQPGADDFLGNLPVNGLVTLVYSSRALCPQRAGVLADIRRAAMARNARLGVTGFLHREDDMFFQCLEGPREALQEIMALLVQDPRHDGIRVLMAEPITERRFAGWSMGVSDRSRMSLFEWITAASGGGQRRGNSKAQDILAFLALAADRAGPAPA